MREFSKRVREILQTPKQRVTATLAHLGGLPGGEAPESRGPKESWQLVAQQGLRAEENERRRIARELHDRTGQDLIGLQLGLKSLQSHSDRPGVIEILKALEALTLRLHRKLHQLAFDLRPASLDDFGLPHALAEYLERWSAGTGITTDLQTFGLDEQRLPGLVETTIYRIVQEALSNILRHANATAVSVIVQRWKEQLVAAIEDDGAGRDANAQQSAYGGKWSLALMRERARILDGEMTIEPARGHGTALLVRIPL